VISGICALCPVVVLVHAATPFFTAIACSRQTITPQALWLDEVLTPLGTLVGFAVVVISANNGTVESVPLLELPMFQYLSPDPAWIFAQYSSDISFGLTILDPRFYRHPVI
jgi:hypothetical protein